MPHSAHVPTHSAYTRTHASTRAPMLMPLFRSLTSIAISNAPRILHETATSATQLVFLQDISERKRIASELERGASELTRLVDTSTSAIFGIDKHGKVNEWNQMAAKITGYSKEEVMGKDLVPNYIATAYRASFAAIFSQALRGIQSSNIEIALLTRTQSHVKVVIYANWRTDGRGKVIGVFGFGQV